jgi:hypothetical protein
MTKAFVRIHLLVASAVALSACPGNDDNDEAPALAAQPSEREAEEVEAVDLVEEPERLGGEGEPVARAEERAAQEQAPTTEGEAESLASGDDDLSGTLILEGPMRVEFPAGFPTPALHREQGELHGFAFSTTTYESYSDLFGLIAASLSEFEAEAFGVLTPGELLDGVKETLLIELGGDIVREEREQRGARHSLDLILRTQLRQRAATIRVVAHVSQPHLAQAMLISPNEGGVTDPIAEGYFRSLELTPVAGSR